MLRSIPASVLKDTAVFHVACGLDRWQKPTACDVTVKYCHIQPTNEIRKSTTDADVTLWALLFVDAKRTNVNVYELNRKSQANGFPLTVTVTSAGMETDYEVKTVDAVPDIPSGRTHHWEVGLI